MRKTAFVAVFLLFVIVFIIGFIVGKISSPEVTDVTKLLKDNELNTQAFLLEQELFSDMGCDYARSGLGRLSDKLWQLGKILDRPTAEQDLGAANYDYLKRKYHLLQIRAYTAYKKISEECGSKDVVLFYFSRNDNLSSEQGSILDSLVSARNLTVFALEYNYSPEMNFVEKYYGISQTPSVVVNYSKVFTGLTPAEVLEPYLWNNQK